MYAIRSYYAVAPLPRSIGGVDTWGPWCRPFGPAWGARRKRGGQGRSWCFVITSYSIHYTKLYEIELRGDESLLPMGLTDWYETEALLRGGDSDLARAEVERLRNNFV